MSRYRLLLYDIGTSSISTAIICQGLPIGILVIGALVGAGSFDCLISLFDHWDTGHPSH